MGSKVRTLSSGDPSDEGGGRRTYILNPAKDLGIAQHRAVPIHFQRFGSDGSGGNEA